MLRNSLMIAACLIAAVGTFAQSPSHALLQAQVDVTYLAADLLEGRETGLKGEEMAAEYVAFRFEQLGLQPKGEQGSWYHYFDFNYNPNPHAAGGEQRRGRNVLGYLDNGAAHTIVIGAHYDHLGYGEFSSLYTGSPAIHNGADDNASGVAALFYLASQLKNNPLARGNNYLFMAFSGEELGLVGSKKWVNAPTIDLSTVNYMINMDMVGCLNEEKVLAINGTGTSPTWAKVIQEVKVGGIVAKTNDSGIGPSDHTAFYLQNIPALHFFSGQHNRYHKPADDPEHLNFPGILAVGDFIVAIITKTDGMGKLQFTPTKNENEERQAAAFKVSLGVMPDYVYNGKGMRVDSVIDERAGHKAGMKNGDVVLRIGDVAVEDIYDYMEGLSKFKAGDSADVVVKRGEEELTLKVVF